VRVVPSPAGPEAELARLARPTGPWIHLLDAAPADARQLGWLLGQDGIVVRHLRGHCGRSTYGLLDEVGAALQLPGDPVEDWVGLAALLTDMSWLPGAGHVLVVSRSSLLLAASPPAELGGLVEVVREVARARAEEGEPVPFHLVLQDDTLGLAVLRARLDAAGARYAELVGWDAEEPSAGTAVSARSALSGGPVDEVDLAAATAVSTVDGVRELRRAWEEFRGGSGGPVRVYVPVLGGPVDLVAVAGALSATVAAAGACCVVVPVPADPALADPRQSAVARAATEVWPDPATPEPEQAAPDPPPPAEADQVVEEQPADAPVVDGRLVDGPVVEGRLADGPVAVDPVAEGGVVDGPVVEGRLVDGPVAVDPVAVDPVAVDPVAEGGVVDGPVVEGPVVEGPVVGGRLVAGPVVEGPVVEGRVVEGGVVEEPVGERAVGDEWAVEKGAAHGPAVDAIAVVEGPPVVEQSRPRNEAGDRPADAPGAPFELIAANLQWEFDSGSEQDDPVDAALRAHAGRSPRTAALFRTWVHDPAGGWVRVLLGYVNRGSIADVESERTALVDILHRSGAARCCVEVLAAADVTDAHRWLEARCRALWPAPPAAPGRLAEDAEFRAGPQVGDPEHGAMLAALVDWAIGRPGVVGLVTAYTGDDRLVVGVALDAETDPDEVRAAAPAPVEPFAPARRLDPVHLRLSRAGTRIWTRRAERARPEPPRPTAGTLQRPDLPAVVDQGPPPIRDTEDARGDVTVDGCTLVGIDRDTAVGKGGPEPDQQDAALVAVAEARPGVIALLRGVTEEGMKVYCLAVEQTVDPEAARRELAGAAAAAGLRRAAVEAFAPAGAISAFHLDLAVGTTRLWPVPS
jgi:hypothetical protein